MLEPISKVDKKRISILGCGWLGFPLAQRLKTLPITSTLKGSTTSPDKIGKFEAHGIEGFLISLVQGFDGQEALPAAFFEADALIISLPPRSGQHGAGFYPVQIEAIAQAIRQSTVSEVIFISSTSVYPDLNRVMLESDVISTENSPSPDIVAAENIIMSLRPERSVAILRLGGLLGYNRIPGKYVRGQKEIKTGSVPVNYIHRDDAVDIISAILSNGVPDQVYNVVAPQHPTRREVYEQSCTQFGWEAPTYAENTEMPAFKIISAAKLAANFPYEFKYPDPLGFYYTLENI